MKIFKFAVAPLIVFLGLIGALCGQEIEARLSFRSEALAALSSVTVPFETKSDYRSLDASNLGLDNVLGPEEVAPILKDQGYTPLSSERTLCVMGSRRCEGYVGEFVFEKQTDKTTFLALNYDSKPYEDGCKINFRNIIEVDVERN